MPVRTQTGLIVWDCIRGLDNYPLPMSPWLLYQEWRLLEFHLLKFELKQLNFFGLVEIPQAPHNDDSALI